ncbi:cobalamin-independent methionine synthase II family protein [Trebonia sp.]|uniref:cobalamin-independent methionine synthase II family protein n=1 Tax=Trebonia sp. TaxID=2767075 RepID=UPI002629411B|nr:cobalamin-independent methionine synthase II family protein [Trebonia sp.]
MQRSVDRIYTTHVGSLARPVALLDLMRASAAGELVDQEKFDTVHRQAVADAVARQRAAGLDVISDGEQGKAGFFSYIGQRLSGYTPGAGRTTQDKFRPEIDAFPEYYEAYFKRAMTGGMAVPAPSLDCTGPVSYIGQEQIAGDLAALRAAVGDAGPDEVFVCAVAPSGVGDNHYYRDEEEYLDAVADALHVEYRAIVDAGFTLQIDEPFLTEEFSYLPASHAEKLETVQLYVDAINRGLAGIPRDRVRLHTCYGINEGPRVHDAPLSDLIDTLLQIDAGAFSFEAANPRHEHSYHVFETVKLPPDTVLLPGVISHATSIVEHPDTIADRIVRFAEVVGRENVVASADCGFSSQATYIPEIQPKIVWAKFEALAEGARRATARLW